MRIREEWLFDGWFFRQGGETCGPVSTGQLEELLGTGRLQPRQAVWKEDGKDLLFVHAVTAATAAGQQSPDLQRTPQSPASRARFGRSGSAGIASGQ